MSDNARLKELLHRCATDRNNWWKLSYEEQTNELVHCGFLADLEDCTDDRKENV